MYFEYNMHVLKENRRRLYEEIKKSSNLENNKEYKINSIKTKTNEYSLEIEKNNTLYRLNSKYNPLQEAKKWAEQYQIKNLDTVIVMFGMGNGIFVQELINNMEQENKIIIYEPSLSIFYHVMKYYNLEKIFEDDRVCIIIEEINNYDFPHILSSTLSWMNLYSKIECIHPNYDKIFEESYNDFTSTIQNNMFNNMVAKNTQGSLGKIILENGINNISYLKNSVSIWELKDDFPSDVPVIIVAAGPSLNKNVEQLKKAKGKSIIICVDRAYEIMLEHSIEPDFIALLDPTKSLKYCGNKKGFTIPLLCKLEGSPDILNNHDGKKIIYNCEEYYSAIYSMLGKKFESITTGGSVATASFAIAAKMGFEKIILVGQDLAYVDNLTHAGNINETKSVESNQIRLFVEDIEGNKIQTRHDWYNFLTWFESIILQLSEVEIIDATEGGAYIRGTQVMKLKDAIDKYCNKEFDCASLIKSKNPTFNEGDTLKIYNYIQAGQEELEEIKMTAKSCVRKCEKLIQNYYCNKANRNKKIFETITEENNKIVNKSVYSLVDQYVLSEQTDNIEELYFMTNNAKTDEIIAYKNAKKIYETIIEACEFILPKIENAIKTYKDTSAHDFPL